MGLGLNLFPGYNGMYLAEGIYGIDALRTREYEDLVEGLGLFRVVAFTTPQIDETSRKFQAAFDAFNVGYFLGTEDAIPGWKRVADLDLKVFSSPTTWPRAFFVNEASRYSKLPELVAQIQASPGKPFAALQEGDEAAVLPMPRKEPGSGVTVAARDYAMTNNTTSFTIDAPSPGIAVLTETWLRNDFRVSVDGRPADYFRVNHAFKGVYLEKPGTHRISFAYWPRHLTASLWGAALGLVLGATSFRLAWGRNALARAR